MVGELVVVEEKDFELGELAEGEAGREGGEFVVGKINFSYINECVDEEEVLEGGFLLCENEDLDLEGVFDG